MGHDFWIVQPDTYWRKNLFEIANTRQMLGLDGNLLFDQEGDKGLLIEMIAGGYFFVKGGPKSECFFDELSRQLENYYATDNNIMGALCITQYCNNKCAFIPYSIVGNWRWHSSGKTYIPALLQFDNGGSSSGKFECLKRLGAEFANITKISKHYRANCFIRRAIAPEKAVPEWRLKAEGDNITKTQRLITFFHEICEWFYEKFPKTGYILHVWRSGTVPVTSRVTKRIWMILQSGRFCRKENKTTHDALAFISLVILGVGLVTPIYALRVN
ncbi:unnamed protein product [Litomosoides sigmodontis]|uniref:Nucleotide-diphospho-sugar transferase domain-containing protein n=1 Tax=Litomosoides sigmodontis TaxID=42156 RepID=A0A3P6SG67_LITSI|nr:unnamed protein product [Litomosoides sigmodontis]